MNRRQRQILIVVAVIIAVMMLYPPYYFTQDLPFGKVVRHRYDWLFSDGDGRIEGELLLAQFVAVGVIGYIAYLLAGDKNK